MERRKRIIILLAVISFTGMFTAESHGYVTEYCGRVLLDVGNYESGQVWNDVSRHNSDAQLGSSASADSNDPNFVGDSNGFYFDGNDLMVIPGCNEFNPGYKVWNGAAFTYEIWAKVNDVNVGSQTLFSQRITNGRGQGLITDGCGGVIFFISDSNGVASNHYSNANSLKDETWHHIAVVGRTYNDNLTVYVDGNNVTDTSRGDGNNVTMHGWPLEWPYITIGDANLTTSWEPLTGNIAAFRYYTRTLSPNEISENYQAGYNLTPPTPENRGQTWQNSRPLTISGMAFCNDANFVPENYKAANLNMVLTRWEMNIDVNDVYYDNGLEWFGALNTYNEIEWVTGENMDFNERIDTYGSSPGCAGYYIVDEMRGMTRDDVQVHRDYLVEHEPNLLAVVTAWGIYASADNLYGSATRPPYNYELYLRDVLDIKPDVLMFVSYPFGPDNSPYGSQYFKNMKMIRDAAQEANIPYWSWLQAYKNVDPNLGATRREPSESDLRLNMYSNLGYGLTGFSYWFWNVDDPNWAVNNTGLADANHTPRLPTYEYCERIVREASNLGPALLELKNIEVYSSGPNCPIEVDDYNSYGSKYFTFDSDDPNSRWQISLFEDLNEPNDKYFMIGNRDNDYNMNSLQLSNSFTLPFDYPDRYLDVLDKHTGNVKFIRLDQDANDPNKYNYSATLPGGTGDLFKVYTNGSFAGTNGESDTQVRVQLDSSRLVDVNNTWFDSGNYENHAYLGDSPGNDEPNIVQDSEGWTLHFVRDDNDNGDILRIPSHWTMGLGNFDSTSNPARFTVEVWVDVNCATSGQAVWDFRDVNGMGALLKTMGTDKLQFELYTGDTNDANDTKHRTQAVVTSEVLHHVVVVGDCLADANDQLHIYLDGNDVTDSSVEDGFALSGHTGSILNGQYGIGRPANTAGTEIIPMTGRIGGFRLYKTPLSAAVIKSHYVTGMADCRVRLDMGDFVDCGIWQDRSGYGNDGVLGFSTDVNSMPVIEDINDGPVLRFKRDTDDYGDIVKITQDSSMALGDFNAPPVQFSIETWVDVNCGDNGQGVWDLRTSVGKGALLRTIGTNMLQFELVSDDWTSTKHRTTAVVTEGTLHHVMVVADGNDLTIYVDGSDATDPNTLQGKDISSHTTTIPYGDYGLGSPVDTSGTAIKPMNGKMGGFRIYRTALTSQQVSYRYAAGIPDVW
ncbi:MAG: LamG domain-containing protein [Planctomycetota bacterium]